MLANTKTASDTRSRYLDAAEALFIALGYEGASVRAISTAAGAHLGTLTYYFGTKEALFRAVCERRFDPIRAEQLARLKVCAARLKAKKKIALREPILALVAPPLLAHADDPELQRRVRLLYGRALTEPSDVVLAITEEIFREATAVFRRCVRALLPDLDERVFHRRYVCAIGAFTFAQSFGERVDYAVAADHEADWPAAVEEIADFMVRGLKG